jgi:Lipocalin-like domain
LSLGIVHARALSLDYPDSNNVGLAKPLSKKGGTSVKELSELALTFLVSVALAVGVTSSAFAQKSLKDQVVGTWTPGSVENVNKDGIRRQEFGPNPKGIYVFEPTGYYVVVLTRPDVPKYASNDRLMGTAEENTAAAQGVLAFFGTYTVNEADRNITLHVDGSSYPNINGADRKFAVTKLTEDELDYSVPTPTAGAAAQAVLKRVK